MHIPRLGGIGQGKLGVDLESLRIDLLNGAVQHLGPADGNFNIPLEHLDAVPGDGSLCTKYLWLGQYLNHHEIGGDKAYAGCCDGRKE